MNVKSHTARIALLAGGRSAEHEVSLVSAKNIAGAIDSGLFDVRLIGITKDGRRLISPVDAPPQENCRGFLLNPDNPKTISLDEAALVPFDDDFSRFDAVFPVLHGPYGEDGVVQGFLAMNGVPFVGSGVLGSALGMDKDIAKRLLRAAGIPVADFITCRRGDNLPLFSSVAQKLKTPLFVKPANMGSSVGVYKVHNEAEWEESLRGAFCYDNKIIIEEFIAGREIECAVLGNGDKAAASCLGEIIPAHEFYSYDAKYIDENGARLEIPAKVPAGVSDSIREAALKTFQTLQCEDISRVDFFLKKDGSFVVNEINTMPGFTQNSMYPKLMAESGVTYRSLITRLIQFALAKKDLRSVNA